MEFPFCKAGDYTDGETPLKTVSDVRKLIEGLPDNLPVYLYVVDTTYPAAAEARTQECFEHNGKHHNTTGLMFFIEG